MTVVMKLDVVIIIILSSGSIDVTKLISSNFSFAKDAPRITQHPVRSMSIRLGGQFRIECHASGFPAPFINWRLNWGHVCEEPRCVASNEEGRGVFTVSNARAEDAGAYSCEAINTVGRKFAEPDTIVEINDGDDVTGPTTTTTDYHLNMTRMPHIESSHCHRLCNNHSDSCRCNSCYVSNMFVCLVESGKKTRFFF